jgi:hypothetical protein
MVTHRPASLGEARQVGQGWDRFGRARLDTAGPDRRVVVRRGGAVKAWRFLVWR